MSGIRQRSIRFRLTAWYSLALAAGLALFGISIWLSMRHSLLRDTDRTLAEGAQSLQLFINQELGEPHVQLAEELDEYSHALPPNTFTQVKNEAGTIVFATPEKFGWSTLTGLGPVFRAITWQGHPYRLIIQTAAVRGRSWTISLAAPLDNIDHLLDRLRMLLLMLSPVVLIISIVAGAWLSRRALKPVDQMTAAAASIGIENMSQRLAIPQTGDELQRLAETWNGMLSRLEHAVSRISRFTADASHELRTPLAVIRSTAEVMLRRPRSSQEYRQAFDQIVSESEHMTALIEDLLFLARSDADALQLPMTALDLAPVVVDVCSRMQLLAAQTHVGLDCCTPATGAAFVRANEQAVRRLLLVLIDNAIKYSRPDGTVTVDLTCVAEEVRLAVRDSGPGIPQAESQRIFERFYRSPEARAAVSGAGLGLSLAASIARRHSAAIRVSSTPDLGSTFTVAFPSGAAPGPQTPTQQMTRPLSTHSLVVVTRESGDP